MSFLTLWMPLLTLWMGLVPLQKTHGCDPCFFCHVRSQGKDSCLGSRFSPDPEPAVNLVLDSPGCRTVRSKCLLFISYLVYGTYSSQNRLREWPPTFWASGSSFVEDHSFMHGGWGGCFQDDSSMLHLLCTLLLRQLHLRSSGIRSWRLETPELRQFHSV